MSWFFISSSIWLGILTAISPCPLATNIAAISFIGRQLGNKRRIMTTGLLYTLGRVMAYVILGVVIVAGVMASGDLSRFLQMYMNEILGPGLIFLGMILLGMLGAGISMNLIGHEKLNQYAQKNCL